MRKKEFDTKDNLDRIRELTKEVMPLPAMSDIHFTEVDYKVHMGRCFGSGLYNDGDVAVQIASMEPNTVLHNHYHDMVEFLIIYEGELTLHMKDKTVVLKKGEALTIEPGGYHLAESKEGCKMVGITVPAAKGYPSGK